MSTTTLLTLLALIYTSLPAATIATMCISTLTRRLITKFNSSTLSHGFITTIFKSLTTAPSTLRYRITAAEELRTRLGKVTWPGVLSFDSFIHTLRVLVSAFTTTESTNSIPASTSRDSASQHHHHPRSSAGSQAHRPSPASKTPLPCHPSTSPRRQPRHHTAETSILHTPSTPGLNCTVM